MGEPNTGRVEKKPIKKTGGYGQGKGTYIDSYTTKKALEKFMKNKNEKDYTFLVNWKNVSYTQALNNLP